MLLVDSTKGMSTPVEPQPLKGQISFSGVQAQTIANFYLALERDLAFVPVVTKTDLSHADFERVAEEMETAFGQIVT